MLSGILPLTIFKAIKDKMQHHFAQRFLFIPFGRCISRISEAALRASTSDTTTIVANVFLLSKFKWLDWRVAHTATLTANYTVN